MGVLRRLLYAIAACLAVGSLAVVVVGSALRARVNAAARKYGLELHLGGVHVGWFCVYLDDVIVRPIGWSGLSASLTQVRVPLAADLRPREVEVRGGDLELRGSESEVLDGVRHWRSSFDAGLKAPGGRKAFPVTISDVDLTWQEGGGFGVDLRGFSVRRDAAGTRLAVNSGQFRAGRRLAAVTDGWVALSNGLAVSEGRIATLSIAMDAEGSVEKAKSTVPEAEDDPPGKPEDAGEPLIVFPDPRGLRALVAVFAARLGDRMQPGAHVAVDALTFKLGAPSTPSALTVGPGSFSLSRVPSGFAVHFTAGRIRENASLSFHAVLPTGGGDLTLLVQGGPLSFSALGAREGEWGLVGTDRATVAGRVSVDLAGDGASVTFDADGAVRGVALREPRLAPDVVHGIDLAVQARGVVESGRLRLDDFSATLGTIHLIASGLLDQGPDHVAASLRADVASASCQSILDSLPTSLLPALQGAKATGTFGARGQLSFDTRSIGDLRLDYEVEDNCRAKEVPESLSRDHFRGPFIHRIYLPDGTLSERETGPGTKDWTPLEAISPYMEVAVMTTEDGAFLKHRGFNRGAIRASLIANLKARRFVRGASTITMQLAKNLFLSREKTLSRKLEEVVLTEYLEQAFTKDELLELYLNVIEFGPGLYGIGDAADYYFGRTPAELNLAECLFLSSLLPAPLRYSKMHAADLAPDAWMKALRATMKIANKRGLVSDSELAEALAEPVVFWHGGERPEPRPPVRLHVPIDAQDLRDDFEPPPLTP